MTPTEQRYAQIEKEGLALTWACERFQDYLVGLRFHVETDHKPLVPLLSNKLLDELPLQIQRFRMRLMRFSFSISHVPGKDLSTADALSRTPFSNTTSSDELLSEEADAYLQMAVQSLSATEKRLKEVRSHQQTDLVCTKIATYRQDGWPSKYGIHESAKPFYSITGKLSVQNGLLMRGSRIVIPADMQAEVLTRLHSSHQGISKSRQQARQSVWWPGMSSDLERAITKCSECTKNRPPRAEPFLPTQCPLSPGRESLQTYSSGRKQITSS